MSEKDNQKLLQEYRERHTKWADRTLSQMSFYNNLLLTVGIGFLSFAYQEPKVINLVVRINNIDWPLAAYSISILTISLSALTGFMASISRLYDFRITSQINLIRQRVLEHSKVKIDEETPNKFSFWKVMYLPIKLFIKDYPTITLEQCKAWEKNEKNLNENFVQLRTLSYNLGSGTWIYIKLQTLLFMLAVVLYAVSILLS